MWAWMGALGVSRIPGIVSPSYGVYRPKDVNLIHAQYYDSLLRTPHYVAEYVRRSTGIHSSRLRLYPDEFLRMPLLFPPLEEQTQIAKFLDYETAKIDALIAKQQQLIALLQEKRQAVISHAVTKGLNPAAPLRDSGVAWLGQVPAHWEVGKCGFYLNILSGFAFPSTGFSNDEKDVRLLRGINVGVSRTRWEETVRWRRVPGDGLDPYMLAKNDLVIGMDRPVISEGVRVSKIGSDDLPCLLLQRVASLKTGKLLSSDYLMHLLSSDMFEAHFSPETTGVSVPHISPSQIADFVIPIPPIEEQEQIVQEVAEQVQRIDMLIARSTEAVELLQERRTALISAAVTGKIDVRGWQPPPAAADGAHGRVNGSG
jgi:type I restriction enzyme S subunit